MFGGGSLPFFSHIRSSGRRKWRQRRQGPPPDEEEESESKSVFWGLAAAGVDVLVAVVTVNLKLRSNCADFGRLGGCFEEKDADSGAH